MIYRPWYGQQKPPSGAYVRPVPGHALMPVFSTLFNEGGGALVGDVMQGPSATITGDFAWAQSPLGPARYFDATDYADFGKCPNLDAIATPRGVTLDVYFRQDEFTNAFMCCKYSTAYHFGLYTQAGSLYFWDNTTSHGAAPYTVSAWHRATVTAGANEVLLIVDGVKTAHGSGVTINAKAESFAIATRGSEHGYTWKGYIGWLTIWPFEMSEVAAREVHANPWCWLGTPDLASMWAAQAPAVTGRALFLGSNLWTGGKDLLRTSDL